MTIKEIKAEIQARMDQIVNWKEKAFQGEYDGLEWVLEVLLENLEPSWHPYPEEVPEKDGEYVVTVPFEGSEQVTYAEFEQGRWLLPTFCYNCLGYADTPIAWKEKDEPYKKGTDK